MTYRYAFKWTYIELVVALVMTLFVYISLRPEWWGWLLYSPLLLYLIFEVVRKVTYTLIVDGDNLTVGSFKATRYSVSKISAVKVWDAKGGRMAVVDFADGRRFHFSSRLAEFDDLVSLLRTKAKLPLPS